MTTFDFLTSILPPAGHYCLAVKLPKGMKHYWYESIAAMAKAAVAFDQKGETVYHACASFKTPDSRKAPNAACVQALWLDLDVGEGDNKYPTQQAALEALVQFVQGMFGAPHWPNFFPIIINSGGGLHVYWPLTEAVTPEEWLPVAQRLKSYAAGMGLKADPSRTADLASVLRPVGTRNHKFAPPKNVTQIKAATMAHPLAVLADRLPPDLVPAERASPSKEKINEQFSLSTQSGEQLTEEKIAELCEALSFVSPEEYDTWLRVGMALHATGHEAAFEVWSAWSERSSKFDAQTQQAKWDSFSASRSNGVTLGTIYALAKENGWARSISETTGQLGTPESTDTQPATVEQLNEHYAWLRKQQQIFRFKYDDFAKPDTFKVALGNRKITIPAGDGEKAVSIGQLWLGWPGRREHEDMVFRPGEPRITDNNVNLWKGWGTEFKAGDTTPWHRLMEFVFQGDPVARPWFEQWLAYPIQHPGTKLYTAANLWSLSQGVGKTLIGETVGLIYGEHYRFIEAREVTANHSTWVRCAQFVNVDESETGDKRDYIGRLKSLITGRVVLVDEKFQPKYFLENRVNLFFTSNSPHAVFVDGDDRRFFVWEIEGQALERAFYQEFLDWRDRRGGLAALAHYLLTLDLSGFDPKARALDTRPKQEMVEISRSDLERWLEDTASGVIKKELVTSQDLAQEYYMHTGNRASTTAIGRALKRMRVPKARPMVNGHQPVLHAIRNVDKWKNTSPSLWGEHYVKGV